MFSRRGRIEVKKYPKFEDKRQVVGHVASTRNRHWQGFHFALVSTSLPFQRHFLVWCLTSVLLLTSYDYLLISFMQLTVEIISSILVV